MASKWCRPASPRLASLGILPRGHRPLDSGSDLVLEAVDSCLALTQGDDRPAGLEEAGQPASGTFQPFVSPMLCLDGYDCSRVVDHYLVLGFVLICGSFDPCQCLSVHLIKPTSNP